MNEEHEHVGCCSGVKPSWAQVITTVVVVGLLTWLTLHGAVW